MPGLLEHLSRHNVLLADGAWGSHFIDQGIDLQLEPPDAWNLHRPADVARLAAAYADSADILSTNTFGANRVRLSHYGLAHELQAINTRGVNLAHEAYAAQVGLDRPRLVAGAVGPARGPGVLQPDDDTLFEVFREQVMALAEAGASFILLETMTDLTEARVAVQAARSACPLEVVCSFSFRAATAGHFETWSGDSVEAALDAVLAAGATVVGANCIPATPAILPLLESMRRFSGAAPLWFKPNAGTPVARDMRLDYPCPLRSAPLDALLDLLGHGVIGGCCGTTPQDVAHLRYTLDRRARQ
jgi:5-methyltetrahydrofolate--homocysteine methyltransferase